jgi:hypothetical protein
MMAEHYSTDDPEYRHEIGVLTAIGQVQRNFTLGLVAGRVWQRLARRLRGSQEIRGASGIATHRLPARVPPGGEFSNHAGAK